MPQGKSKNRKHLLKRISDGYLPQWLTKQLYVVYVNKPPIQINGWSGMHFLSGICVAFLGLREKIALIIHTCWELFQFIAGDNRMDIETFVDIGFDTLFYYLGYKFLFI